MIYILGSSNMYPRLQFPKSGHSELYKPYKRSVTSDNFHKQQAQFGGHKFNALFLAAVLTLF
jgi:hypothetical protein